MLIILYLNLIYEFLFFFIIKKIAEDVQSLKENLENKYEHKIKKQKDEINRLKEFNSVLTEIIEEQKKNNKLELINERINYLEDDK